MEYERGERKKKQLWDLLRVFPAPVEEEERKTRGTDNAITQHEKGKRRATLSLPKLLSFADDEEEKKELWTAQWCVLRAFVDAFSDFSFSHSFSILSTTKKFHVESARCCWPTLSCKVPSALLNNHLWLDTGEENCHDTLLFFFFFFVLISMPPKEERKIVLYQLKMNFFFFSFLRCSFV